MYEHMRLRYETAIATFIQFVVTSGLTVISSIDSIISGCHANPKADCVSNAFVSLILLVITIGILGGILALGYFVQDRRSSKMAYMLIGIESFASLLYLFEAKQSPAIIDKATNLLSGIIAIWVVVIAWRLARAKGGRIVNPKLRHSLQKHPKVNSD